MTHIRSGAKLISRIIASDEVVEHPFSVCGNVNGIIVVCGIIEIEIHHIL